MASDDSFYKASTNIQQVSEENSESYWPEVISNKDLWIRTGQEPNITTIKRRRWKWIGHTLRKGERNIARHAMDWNPQGTPKRGRPRTTWRRSIQKDLKEINMTWCEAKRAP